jgi:hypothetical protein
VDLGVMGRAERNQEPLAGDAGLSLMHVEVDFRRSRLAADPAGAPVTIEDFWT